MFFFQFCFPHELLLFPVTFLYLVCLNFTAGTQTACNDLLTSASNIRAMLHNEETDQFYLLTSSGHIFIEPISNFDPESSPPSLTLTEAKYSMPTEWNINNYPETIKAESEDSLPFWVNPDKSTETLLNKVLLEVWRKICVFPGVKLDEEKAQVEKATGLCYTQRRLFSPDFWLGFNSQSYGMVRSNGIYCLNYLFPNSKSGNKLWYRSPLEASSECLGLALEDGKPRCGVVHKEGNVAVVIQDSSTVYVYRNILSSKDKNWLNEFRQIASLPQPTKHQINEFIKCEAKTNSKEEEQPEVNHQEPINPNEPNPESIVKPKKERPNESKLNPPMKWKLFLIFLGVLLLAAIVFGLAVKFKLIQAFPWKRKRKGKGKTMERIISQAYSIAISKAISKASVVPRESALQQILQKAPLISKLKVDKKQGNEKLTAPGVVTKMLDTFQKRMANTVRAAKKPKKKKKKKKKGK